TVAAIYLSAPRLHQLEASLPLTAASASGLQPLARSSTWRATSIPRRNTTSAVAASSASRGRAICLLVAAPATRIRLAARTLSSVTMPAALTQRANPTPSSAPVLAPLTRQPIITPSLATLLASITRQANPTPSSATLLAVLTRQLTATPSSAI